MVALVQRYTCCVMAMAFLWRLCSRLVRRMKHRTLNACLSLSRFDVLRDTLGGVRCNLRVTKPTMLGTFASGYDSMVFVLSFHPNSIRGNAVQVGPSPMTRQLIANAMSLSGASVGSKSVVP